MSCQTHTHTQSEREKEEDGLKNLHEAYVTAQHDS